jgi:hypothetical protein
MQVIARSGSMAARKRLNLPNQSGGATAQCVPVSAGDPPAVLVDGTSDRQRDRTGGGYECPRNFSR